MRNSIKKVTTSKKPVVRKPMMKKGGTTKRLKRYQDEGEVMMGPPAPASTPATPSKTFADTYKANIAAGLNPRMARKEAEREMGFVQPKRKVDPNVVIDTTGRLIESGVGAFSNRNNIGGGMNSPMGFKKGGVTKTKTVAKPKMAKGGSLKAVPAGKTGLAKLPTEVRNKMGYMKSGGLTKKQAGGMTKKETKSAVKDSRIAEKAQKTYNKFINTPATKNSLNMKRLGKKVQRLTSKLKK
jgi:hypothetical protein